MRVKSCVASDGSGHVIKLSDEYGCVLRPKMISRFLKARAPDERATVITYAFFHAFKFPDALSVHIKCKVEICRHGCLDHCQVTGNVHERKDTLLPGKNHNDLNFMQQQTQGGDTNDNEHHSLDDDPIDDHDVFYDDIIHNGDGLAAIGGFGTINGKSPQHAPQVHEDPEAGSEPTDNEEMNGQYMELKKVADDKFPHGPRFFEAAQNRMGAPAVAGPRSLNLDDESVYRSPTDNDTKNEAKHTRRRRFVTVSDRKARSADVGVSSLYEVISEADLAFSPDTKQEAVTVFQGKITEEVVYGICMPVPGFSVLFIAVTSAAIVSALIAGSLLYKYQLQKETLAHQKHNAESSAVPNMNVNSFASWMTLRLFRVRHPSAATVPPTQ